MIIIMYIYYFFQNITFLKCYISFFKSKYLIALRIKCYFFSKYTKLWVGVENKTKIKVKWNSAANNVFKSFHLVKCATSTSNTTIEKQIPEMPKSQIVCFSSRCLCRMFHFSNDCDWKRLCACFMFYFKINILINF